MKLKLIILLISCFALGITHAQNTDEVKIPNVFTPNNDGVNDLFQIRANDAYVGLTCTIYNRLGGTVYRYFGLNGTWDGYTHAGLECVAGAYFVVVELEKMDGTIETRQGYVQLVRQKK